MKSLNKMYRTLEYIKSLTRSTRRNRSQQIIKHDNNYLRKFWKY